MGLIPPAKFSSFYRIAFKGVLRIFFGQKGKCRVRQEQRLIGPEEIADVVAFLQFQGVSAITGPVLRVDGGLVRHII